MKKLTHDEFMQRFTKQYNNNYIVLSTYTNSITPIKIQCIYCNKQYNIAPKQLFYKMKYCTCRKNKVLHYIDKINIINNKFPFLTILNINKSKITIQCNDCHTIKTINIANLLYSKYGCCCKMLSKLKTHKQFIYDLSLINNDINVLDKYNGVYNKLLCQCMNNHQFYKTPHELLTGSKCPYCSMSIGEHYCCDYLINNNLIFTYQFYHSNCKDKNILPFDFAIFKTEEDKINKKPWILIEYDGKQHFNAANQRCSNVYERQLNLQYIQKHDEIKTQFCSNNNIILIRIAYQVEYGKMGKKAKYLIEQKLYMILKRILIQNLIGLLRKRGELFCIDRLEYMRNL